MMTDTNNYQDTLALAAYLFDYPNDAWWEKLPACREAVAELKSQQNRQVITDLLDYIEAMGQKEYEEFYVRTFEFSNNTNLYLTMHDRTDFGKQAREMLEFKNLFLENDFDLRKELPDFLPAILELTASISRASASKVLEMAKPKIELLKTRFVEAKLAHTFLLDVILTEADELEGATA